MLKKLSVAASRHTGMRLLRWSTLALAGVVGGMMLGDMAASTRLGGGGGEPANYSRLSANPDALVPQGDIAPACIGCADSYGAAMRLRAHQDRRTYNRMGDEFRELGVVDVDPPTPAEYAEPADDYRYGGRFPDPEPPPRRVAAPTASVSTLDDGAPPIGEAPLLRPE